MTVLVEQWQFVLAVILIAIIPSGAYGLGWYLASREVNDEDNS